MDASIFRDALTALAGVATGVMSGTFGVGGAVISTPAIRALVALLHLLSAQHCLQFCPAP